MPKKRRSLSLQTILSPSFLHQPLTSPTTLLTPFTPDSVQTDPESSFLLDDDPFANLSTAPVEQWTPPIPVLIPITTPRSPLTSDTPDAKPALIPSSPPTIKSRPPSKSFSGSRMQPVSAHQKPAFGPKPSLPSLASLSRMNIVLKKKVRKGRVGAGLPFEPWDSIDSTPTENPTSPGFPFPPPQSTADNLVATSDEFADSEPNDTHHYHHPDNIAFIPNNSTPELAYNSTTSELAYNSNPDNDTEFSSPSLPALSPNTSSASLSRSLSTSSSGSDDFNFTPATTTSNTRYSNSDLATTSSAVSELDLLTTPSHHYFSFPTGHYTSTSISGWRQDADTAQDDYEPELDIQEQEQNRTESFYTEDELELMYQPGTSAATLRPPMHIPVSTRTRYADDQLQVDDVDTKQYVDSTEYDAYRRADSSNTHRPHNYTTNGFRSISAGNRHANAGNGNEEGVSEHGRRRIPDITSSSEVSDDDVNAEEYVATSDDDIPLAQRIPTALVAQKSIRKKVREERDQRRRERSEKAVLENGGGRSRQATLRPAGTGNPSLPISQSPQVILSSSQEASRYAKTTGTGLRPRTQTLPGRSTPPFSAEDLSRKLQDVQVQNQNQNLNLNRMNSGKKVPSTTTSRVSGEMMEGYSHGHTHVYGQQYGRSDSEMVSQNQSPGQMLLRHARSFVRPKGTNEDHRSNPISSSQQPPPPFQQQRLERARSKSRLRDDKPPSAFSFQDVPVPLMPRLTMKHSPETKSTRPSLENERSTSRSRRPSTTGTMDNGRPPVPPFPDTIPTSTIPIPIVPKQVTQQRVFIGDMQSYNVVEIDDSTTAGNVIEMLEVQGSLKGWNGVGEWMVWEVAHDFGMERPVRNFERISDVQASWNKDKMVNTFVVKLTPLATLLRRSAIPSSSPTYSGYVEWESKRGKWNKRWLMLREHSLWISKRDNGKDETLLCSLSNFDAYHISRLYKSPKPFVFAVKSTDKLSFFENAADYLHVVSCSEKDGKVWMEKILLARSYVLHQERNVLFNPKSYGGQPTVSLSNNINNNGVAISGGGGGGGLSRANTSRRPTQPLVSMGNNDVFEPGSLLHRKG